MKNLLVMVLGLVTLAGCKPILSNVLQGPDEMAVVDAAPLTLPPNFELRPPRPGQELVTEEAEVARQKAEALITGEEVASTTESTATKTAPVATEDEWLFDQLDAANKDEAPVAKAEESTVNTSEDDRGFFERTFSRK